MSSQHDVLEVDNRDTSADEKKKDEKVWGTFLTRFSGTVKVMRIKWIKSQKVQEVLLSEEELLKDKKHFFTEFTCWGSQLIRTWLTYATRQHDVILANNKWQLSEMCKWNFC